MASLRRCGSPSARTSLARNIWKAVVSCRSLGRLSIANNAMTAAPFHPKGMSPRASCPKCLNDKGDDTPKDLYGIRGLGDGEYDTAIPTEWRQCPAIKLDSSTPGMSAVRVRDFHLFSGVITNGCLVSIHVAIPLLTSSSEALEECCAETVCHGNRLLKRAQAAAPAAIGASGAQAASSHAREVRRETPEVGRAQAGDHPYVSLCLLTGKGNTNSATR